MTNINSKDVQIKHFLKADPFNEEYVIKREDVGSIDTKIVNGSDEFFNHVILNYDEQIPPKKYYIKIIGENQKKPKIYSYELKKWVETNIINSINDTLVYIEGYAGCGKTTWVQTILHQANLDEKYSIANCNIADSYNKVHKDYYIDLYESFTPGFEYSSEVIRFNIVNSIAIRMISTLKSQSKTKYKILDCFCELISNPEIGKLSSRLPNISHPFQKNIFIDGARETTYFYRNAINLHKSKEAEQSFLDVFRHNINRQDINGKYIFSLFDVLCVDYLWRISINMNLVNPSKRIYVCYDNLDIIDDIEALVNFIRDLENLKTNVNIFREKSSGELKIPYIILLATCRKITNSKLTSTGLQLPSKQIKKYAITNDSNEAYERDERRESVIKIELSNLYDYSSMMKKRAEYYRPRLTMLVDNKYVEKLNEDLKKASNLPNYIFDEINYTELWNHNYRACNNVLNRIINDYDNYYNDLLAKYGDVGGANGSILLHIIIKILNNNGQWTKSLGYKDNKLTTLSRLILTFLHNKKRNGNNSVSIAEIATIFGRINFDVDEDFSSTNNIEYICDTMQNMLLRLPNDSEEIWRRPIYFKNNALICENKRISTELQTQLNDLERKNCTSFSITEEGGTFIEKIVPQFEFYSARLNRRSIPLYCISKKSDLISNMSTVYLKVEKCCSRQIEFMKKYMEEYRIDSISDYLAKDFHPVTVQGDKQLHIIRVVFSHIIYLNNYRDYLYCYKLHKFKQFNSVIVTFIRKYLNLYDTHFYLKMQNTIGEYNNIVWNDLVEQYNIVVSSITEKKDEYGVSIKRTKDEDVSCMKLSEINKQKLRDFDFIN